MSAKPHPSTLPAGATGCLAIACWQVPFAVRVTADPVSRRVLDRLPPGSAPLAPMAAEDGDRPVFGVRRSGESPGGHAVEGPEGTTSARGLDQALEIVESAMRAHVATNAPSVVFVHAGVVGWRGAAIVIPGFSGSGKSRLVEALVRAGATYYSDEYAVLDEHGRVHPFAKPISLAQEGSPAKRLVDPASIGGRTAVQALRPRLLIDAAYRPEAVWEPRPLTSGECALAMLQHTVIARLDPARALRVVAKAAEGATGWQGSRGEADTAARAVLDLASWDGPDATVPGS